jgi:hypothetical protein
MKRKKENQVFTKTICVCFPLKVRKLEKDWRNPGRPITKVHLARMSVSTHTCAGSLPRRIPGDSGPDTGQETHDFVGVVSVDGPGCRPSVT